MKHATLTGTVVAIALLLGTSVVSAEAYPWRDHAFPFDFFFGNHIDGFQQSKTDKQDRLQGFLYLRFTGEYGPDGLPIAMHGNCAATGAACEAGWMVSGLPVSATLVAVGQGFPTWCIAPESAPAEPGYTHFHWLDASQHPAGLDVGASYPGYLLKLTARDAFRFAHHGASIAVLPGIDHYSHANVVVGC